MNAARNQPLRIAKILAWEFWARDWPGLLLAILAALVVPEGVFFVSNAANSSANSVSERVFVQSIVSDVSIYWITILCLGSILLLNMGNPRVRNTLPVSSFLLVAVPMACCMLTMFVQYAIVATILNTQFDVEWPIWGPGLLAAVLIAWCHAVFWPTSNSLLLRLVAWLASFGPLAVWAIGDEPIFGRQMHDFLANVGGWDATLLGLATLACVGVGTAGFASLRHGSAIDLPRIIGLVRDQFHVSRAARRAPFSSPRSAQFWLEWVERGYALPVTTALLGTVALGLTCYELGVFGARFNGPRGFVLVAVPSIVAQLILIGFFWGRRSPGFGFGSFGGSRPLSDGQIAAAILKSSTFSLFVSALIWCALFALAALTVALRRGMIGPFVAVSVAEFERLLAASTFGALVIWSAVGFVTSLAVAGRKVMRNALFMLSGTWIVWLALHQYLPHAYRTDFDEIYGKTFFALLLLGSTAAFIASWRWRLLSNRALCLTGLLLLMAITTAEFVHPLHDWQAQLVLLGACGLIPIPLAAAPLAVYHNRHR